MFFKLIKYLLFIFILLISSCGEDVDLLIEKGEYDSAIIILKEELTKDYGNTQLRNKITRLYFTNARKNIRENNLSEAERNVERGIIYSDENNPEISEEYADILVLLGSRLIATGDNSGTVELRRRYEKGISLIEKSVPLTENNKKALAILDAIKSDEARVYLDQAESYYNLWTNDTRNYSLLIESKKNLQLSGEIMKLPGARDLENKILEAFLKQNIRSNPHDIRVTGIFYNHDNGFLAIRIRFHNNSPRNTVVSPGHFTLYDIEGKSYNFDPAAARRGNYRGVLESFMVNPSRFVSGLLVFNIGSRTAPVISNIGWTDGIGNSAEKAFPGISVTEIDFE